MARGPGRRPAGSGRRVRLSGGSGRRRLVDLAEHKAGVEAADARKLGRVRTLPVRGSEVRKPVVAHAVRVWRWPLQVISRVLRLEKIVFRRQDAAHGHQAVRAGHLDEHARLHQELLAALTHLCALQRLVGHLPTKKKERKEKKKKRL